MRFGEDFCRCREALCVKWEGWSWSGAPWEVSWRLWRQLRFPYQALRPCYVQRDCSKARVQAIVGSFVLTLCLQPLHCVAQQYAWGRYGSSSTVARMKDAQALQEDDEDFFIDESAPYAELWLGTHPSGMSEVTVHKELQHGDFTTSSQKHSLLEYVQSDPTLHCGSVQDFSFLLKILSVRKVLSIQAHPDKELAEKLHTERPDVYKDPNHKPEMAIAISKEVRALCGFRPLEEISRHLDEYPEFSDLLGPKTVAEIRAGDEDVRHVLQDMFHGYIEAEEAVIHAHVEQMISRLRSLDEKNETQELILQLEQMFPGDCGIFAPLIFNLVKLNQGEGLFIAANEPHAYVSGEILECMACSDNVVRAGLTPKLKDVHTLVNMLTYKTTMPKIETGHRIDDCTVRYQPPVDDFMVDMHFVPAGQTYEIQAVDSASVLLVLEGEASLKQDSICSLDVSFGSAAFLSANTHCQVEAGPFGVCVVRACSNLR